MLALEHVVAVLLLGEAATAHVAHVLGEGRGGDAGKVGVLLDELRREGLEGAQHVAHDEELAVDRLAGPDAEHRDGQLGRDEGGHLGRHGLEQQELHAGLVQGAGVVDHGLGRLSVRPWALWPPSCPQLCGVRPMWPQTTMPASRIALTPLITRTPPSSLMASTPASFKKRPALATASSSEIW